MRPPPPLPPPPSAASDFTVACLPADMDIGTIGFHNQKAVIKVPHVERIREVEKRIEKSKREEFPDFAGDKERHMHELTLERKKKAKAAAKAKKKEVEEARQAKEARSYDKISAFVRADRPHLRPAD